MRFDGDSPGPMMRGSGRRDPDPRGSHWLDPVELIELIRLGPLVSIDLVVQDPAGRVLVGLRNDEPAKDCWFVPGGRVAKGESLDQAFRRMTKQELGIVSNRNAARFLGVFEHFYETNFLEERDLGTHYVVLAYALRVETPDDIRFDDQHRQVRWLEPERLRSEPNVHRNTKVYGSALLEAESG
ncbi:MAG: GDP-mannose mannosyl hydrolase [Longimicrobiales bacterium]